MAQITFKAKAKQVFNPDGSPAWRVIHVPVFTRSHCDMAAWRQHPRWHGFANSDMFPNILSRLRRDMFKGRDYFRLDQIPEGVAVDESGFLAVITIDA